VRGTALAFAGLNFGSAQGLHYFDRSFDSLRSLRISAEGSRSPAARDRSRLLALQVRLRPGPPLLRPVLRLAPLAQDFGRRLPLSRCPASPTPSRRLKFASAQGLHYSAGPSTPLRQARSPTTSPLDHAPGRLCGLRRYKADNCQIS